MPIPGPGTAISMNTIATEFGGTVPHSLSEYYRGGGLVPNTPTNAAIPTSGQIAIGNFYGSSSRNAYTITISASTNNYDVYTNRGPSYISGASDITVQINPGVTVGSTSVPAYAMSVPSSFSPGDTITIVNNGLIQGMGGAGGAGGRPSPGPLPGVAGASAGSALYVNRPVTVTNNGTIAGGGGGGGGGGAGSFTQAKTSTAYPGGGGGGGSGTQGGAGGPSAQAPRAGGAGTSPAGGAGGPAYTPAQPPGRGGAGGAGGGRGAAGTAGGPGQSYVGGPQTIYPGGGGGAAGNYIVGNPFVTWPATGTRQGGVA